MNKIIFMKIMTGDQNPYPDYIFLLTFFNFLFKTHRLRNKVLLRFLKARISAYQKLWIVKHFSNLSGNVLSEISCLVYLMFLIHQNMI